MRGGERGFSLVEILVALLILTVVITTSMAAFLERNRRMKQANEIVLAYQALANETEYWRRKSFASLDTAPKQFESDPAILEPLKPYEQIVTVTDTQPGVRNVLLTIRWNEGKREAKLELVRVDTGGGQLW
jgi:prepilin-type N-terminal cleavage/methylation domain-containing protein